MCGVSNELQEDGNVFSFLKYLIIVTHNICIVTPYCYLYISGVYCLILMRYDLYSTIGASIVADVDRVSCF